MLFISLKVPNELLVSTDELKSDELKDGNPHDGQIQTPHDCFIRSYMCAERPLH